jgi:excisionase family DNA binding protein
MPYRILNTDEVAKYLHLTRADVDKLVKHRQIPFELRGGRPLFRKQDIEAWASQRILELNGHHLATYHEQSSNAARAALDRDAFLPALLEPAFIEAALHAKTKASVLREMVALAGRTGRVFEPRALLAELEAREGLCSTALPGGLALLHTRHHDPYMFESSFIALGRALQPVHFSAPDGQPTDLFFLICCQDDRLHLHTLARLCMMAQKTEVLKQLREAPDAAAIHDCIVRAEQRVVASR